MMVRVAATRSASADLKSESERMDLRLISSAALSGTPPRRPAARSPTWRMVAGYVISSQSANLTDTLRTATCALSPASLASSSPSSLARSSWVRRRSLSFD